MDRYLFCGLPGQADPWLRAGVLSRKTSLAEVLEASSDLVPGNTMPMATEDGDPNVIWVGRLQVGKDPLTGLEAFKRFSIHHPAARLTIVAPATRPLEAVLRDRLPAGARLIGPLTQAELGDCYARADIILSTSRHEGSGYAVIEAIGLGCTPALSELPSHRVIAGDLGHYFAPGNPVEAAEALERAFRASRATSARERARRHFETFLSWERVSDQLIAAWAHPRARTHSQQ